MASTTATGTAGTQRTDPLHPGDDRAALTATPGPEVFRSRLQRFAEVLGRHDLPAAVVGSGADLQYLVGHSVASHERLTALAVAADGTARLLVPLLERPGWAGTSAEELGLDIATWADGDDQHAALTRLLPDGTRVLGLDNHLPAMHALAIRDALGGADLRLAGAAIAELRMRKDDAELAALAAVAAAIDRVHGRMAEWLQPGRTEDEVGADIAAAIVEEGHAHADFVIVAAGPHGASPHHRGSDTVIRDGDAVVVDIGGPAPSGYCSDSTRTYVAGAVRDEQVREVHEIVQQAQRAGVAAAVAGARCEDVDEASRAVIRDAGYGEHFITRTGHGIGLEVHEHPYLVAGEQRPLEPGMTFSVEPGIYLPGRFGVRIEDIVAVGPDGAPVALNTSPRELLELSGGGRG